VKSRVLRPELRAALKRICAEILYRCGALHLSLKFALRQRAVVLTYHRVLRPCDVRRTWSHPGIIVTAETFERHLLLLGRVFNVLTLREFMSHLETRTPFARPSCLITFDDGWLDTFHEAWPLLRRHRMPAVVFLPTSFIGSTRVFWQENLGCMLYLAWDAGRRDEPTRARFAGLLQPHGLACLLDAGPSQVRDQIRQAVNALKSCPAVVERVVEALHQLSHGNEATSIDRFLNWEQIRQMAADGVTFGGHGSSHRLLTRLPAEEVVEEVRQSKADLERELGCDIQAFSYPNGDWTPQIADAVKAEGFRVSFSTVRGFVSTGDDRFSLRRVNVHEDMTSSEPLFLARLVGLL